ncbi:hypothetical protein TNCT_656621 [Trichonephila clavata]|uniref:Uncharacterized protein n=1 Tax=Trichonephila clavata TaxID=2740835 RepID=A0A8X6GFQ1_TRICU|nr:hypothetical protein TNCT_656621 [Trichonephila clavata]
MEKFLWDSASRDCIFQQVEHPHTGLYGGSHIFQPTSSKALDWSKWMPIMSSALGHRDHRIVRFFKGLCGRQGSMCFPCPKQLKNLSTHL